MVNFGDLLGAFMQGNLSQAGLDRMGHAIRDPSSGVGQATSGGGAAASALLGGLLGAAQEALSSARRDPARAGGLGAVLGSVLGGGGDSVKGAMAGGALAMLASVALKAMTNAGQGGAGQASSHESGQSLQGLQSAEIGAGREALENKARLILKGMINIAKSDGQVGPDEIQRIAARADAAGLDDEGRAWLLTELGQPLDLAAFIAEIPSQEVAAEVYAASLLAVEVDTPQERDYLRQFAEGTGLHQMVVEHIHRSLGLPA